MASTLMDTGGVAAPVQDPTIGMKLQMGAALANQIADSLPPGNFKTQFKTFLSNPNPLSAWKAIVSLIKGRTYRTGQYRLVERFMDNIVGAGNVINSYREAPDELYPVANDFFTAMFGVRIANDEDLWALEQGADAYYARPGTSDANRNAVNRAVMLMKNFYPTSTFNRQKWDLTHFSNYPLVAPIPDPQEGNVGRLFTGTIPGGQKVVQGIIQTPGLIKTDADVIDPTTGKKVGTPVTQLLGGTGWMFGILIVLFILGWWFFGRKK